MPPLCIIRPYYPDDWASICRVYDAAKPAEFCSGGIGASFIPLATDPAQIARFARDSIWVGSKGETIVGFAGHRGDYITWLFVHPEHSRQGIGRALLRKMREQISGVPWLWAMKQNQPALHLYSSEGFAIVEEREANNNGMSCLAVKLQARP